MSGVSSWLQKMRKGELLEICDHVGFKEYDGLKKSEVEIALDDFLMSNSAQFSTDAKVAPFFIKRRNDTSPVKKELVTSDLDSKLRTVRRRTIKAVDELVATDDMEIEPATTRSRTALIRNPRTPATSSLSFSSTLSLPPSPAIIANAVDHNTQVLRRKFSIAYENSGVIEAAQSTREVLSTVVALQSLIAVFEFLNLRTELLPTIYAFTIPEIAFLKTYPYDVKIPDLFILLTSSFWGPATLWAFTSLIVPLLAAYFFNLTAKPSKSRSHGEHITYDFDPLTFSITKALLTYIIYGNDVTLWGLVNLEYVARINSALFGGYQGVLVGTGIGTLVTLYEAILQK